MVGTEILPLLHFQSCLLALLSWSVYSFFAISQEKRKMKVASNKNCLIVCKGGVLSTVIYWSSFHPVSGCYGFIKSTDTLSRS